jgi:hypothetical protein
LDLRNEIRKHVPSLASMRPTMSDHWTWVLEWLTGWRPMLRSRNRVQERGRTGVAGSVGSWKRETGEPKQPKQHTGRRLNRIKDSVNLARGASVVPGWRAHTSFWVWMCEWTMHVCTCAAAAVTGQPWLDRANVCSPIRSLPYLMRIFLRFE